MISRKKQYIELKKGTKFSELDDSGSVPMIIYEDMKVELVKKKMGNTYFKLNERICKAVLVLILFIFPSVSFANTTVDLIVKIAKSEIGKGEKGGNNVGEEVFKYTNGQAVPWCAAFVSWVYQQAGTEVPYLISARSYWELYKERRTDSPSAGDIMCFWRKSKESGLGHVGIVVKVTKKYIYTIEGNRGKRAKVREFRYPRNAKIPRLLGYVTPLQG